MTKQYFAAMGLSLVAGRGFTEQDLLGKPWRVDHQQAARRPAVARRESDRPDGDSLERAGPELKGEVIGVVSDMRERGLESDPTLAVYIPGVRRDGRAPALQLVLHTKGDPEDRRRRPLRCDCLEHRSEPSDLRHAHARGDRDADRSRRVDSRCCCCSRSPALAALLALAGVYGVLAYSVARRTSEIGVRLALGAHRRGLLRRVIAQGMRPVLVGAVIGLLAMYWLSRLMTSLLFGVEPGDPMTYGMVFAALMAAAVLACYFPARAVLRVDPVWRARSSRGSDVGCASAEAAHVHPTLRRARTVVIAGGSSGFLFSMRTP